MIAQLVENLPNIHMALNYPNTHKLNIVIHTYNSSTQEKGRRIRTFSPL